MYHVCMHVCPHLHFLHTLYGELDAWWVIHQYFIDTNDILQHIIGIEILKELGLVKFSK